MQTAEQTAAPVPEQAVSLAEAIDIGLLDTGKAEFFTTAGGFTGLRYNGEEYPRVTLRRALPAGRPLEYISVADKENKEIGMLRSLDDLEPGQRALVAAELDARYYCPIVHAVKSVKDKLGYVYFELEVSRDGSGDRHARSCAIKDVNRNIRMLGEDRLALFDVDGNRFIIPSLAALDKKSLRRLEPYLF